MSKAIIFGGGYQIVNLVLLMFQALVFPRFLGLEDYGFGLFLIVPVLIIGGIWEPVVQRFCIGGTGIPRNWLPGIIGGGAFLYTVYLVFFFPKGYINAEIIALCVFFLMEYIFSIYFLAILQAEKKYLLVFFVSLAGLCLSALTFTLDKHFWLVTLFYTLYFCPLLLAGLVFVRRKLAMEQSEFGGVSKILGAISTRLFYIIINNLYVIIIGAVFGPAKAAVFRVVISFCSAFRFCNPLSIGQFYSMLTNRSWAQKILLALLPLSCFYFGVLIIWLTLPWVRTYGEVVLGENASAVLSFFLEVAWYVPLYLWTPYLTLLYSEVLGWKEIIAVCAFSLASSVVFIYLDNMQLFFGAACTAYCAFLILWGVAKKQPLAN
ncbi:hypothetical protein QQ994_06640 [Pseudomonas asiatica]|uniref:hypothetical protein n=1 Tax=Pseudomonas asiatica TaxID=2219225 RepID=UPI002570CDF1|nr:hypothetical protein [Pseudomonas asiatica]WJD71550.1 hypothetical protein QQ994_06640 [Pseudomonas asiatica]